MYEYLNSRTTSTGSNAQTDNGIRNLERSKFNMHSLVTCSAVRLHLTGTTLPVGPVMMENVLYQVLQYYLYCNVEVSKSTGGRKEMDFALCLCVNCAYIQYLVRVIAVV